MKEKKEHHHFTMKKRLTKSLRHLLHFGIIQELRKYTRDFQKNQYCVLIRKADKMYLTMISLCPCIFSQIILEMITVSVFFCF